MEISKKTRKQLRELLGIAYARELDNHLLELSKAFDNWKNKKVDCWALNDQIHKFHNGISKKLFNTYNSNGVDELYFIARALSLNLLQKDEIPVEVFARVEALAAEFF